jgi:hypothetical protein
LVLSLRRADVVAYLERIGWPGSVDEVRRMIDRLDPHAARLMIHLDLGAEPAPIFAVQFHYPGRHPSWNRLFNALVDEGMSSPEKAAAALEWNGERELVLPGHQWPCTLFREMEVKAILRSTGEWEAKAYLGYAFEISLFGAANPC